MDKERDPIIDYFKNLERLAERPLSKGAEEFKSLGKDIPDNLSFDLIKTTAHHLPSPADQVAMVAIMLKFVDPKELPEISKWARKLSEENGQNLASQNPDIFFDGDSYAKVAKFYSLISEKEYNAFISATPFEYLQHYEKIKKEGVTIPHTAAMNSIKAGLDNLNPTAYFALAKITPDFGLNLPALTQDQIEDRLKKMSVADAFSEKTRLQKEYGVSLKWAPSQAAVDDMYDKKDALDYRPAMLLDIEDPRVFKKLAMDMAKDIRFSQTLLEGDLLSRIKKHPDSQEILNAAFLLTTNLDPTLGTTPLETGMLQYTKFKSIQSLAPAIGRNANDLIFSAAKLDPSVGLEFALANYPKDPDAIKIYQTSLPRANELLKDLGLATDVVLLLNKLEPSQYAHDEKKLTLIPEKDRFKMLDGASAGQLYDLITLTIRDGSYAYEQGTYNEMSRRFYAQLKVEKKSFFDIADSTPERKDGLLPFVEAANDYTRMDQFITATTPDEHHRLSETFFQDGAIKLSITGMVSFVDHLPPNSPSIPFIETSLISAALNGNEYQKADAGLISYWYANQAKHHIAPEHAAFFNGVKADESFKIKPQDAIKSNQLLDAAGRNFQLHVFYNDQDGIDTYKSFSATLKSDGWAQKTQDDFLIFSKEKGGKRIEILVSPPEAEEKAVPNILDYVQGKNGVISVVSGRGHSYHMNDSAKLLTADTRLINLGGCWANKLAASIIEVSPDAHILSTTGVGRMAINNFNTRWVNNTILSGNDLNWSSLQKEWDKLKNDPTVAGDIKNYVAPNQNLMVLYEHQRRVLYKEIEERESAPESTAPNALSNTFMQSVRSATDSVSKAVDLAPQVTVSAAPTRQIEPAH